MTGLLPSTTGIYFLQPGFEASDVAQSQPHLLTVMQAAGYETYGAGKFVSGGNEAKYFDHYGGRFGAFGPNPPEKINCDQGGPNWDWGVYPASDELLPDWHVADWIIEQIEASHDRPFFMAAGFWRPHVPMYVPQKWHDLFPIDEVQLPQTQDDDRSDLSDYAIKLTNGLPAPRHDWFLKEGKWRAAVQSYLASVAFVDHCVGRVLSALDHSGLRDNTIVVLLSDHGFHLGEKQRWAKRSLWGDCTRVPLVISVPGFQAGKVCHSPAGLIDLFPTLLDLVDIQSKLTLDGESLVTQLKDSKVIRDRPAICTFGPKNHSLHFQRWHFIRYADGTEELYDLVADPHEWENLADESEQQSRLKRLREHLPTSNAAPIRSPNWNRWEVEDWMNAETHEKNEAQPNGK